MMQRGERGRAFCGGLFVLGLYTYREMEMEWKGMGWTGLVGW